MDRASRLHRDDSHGQRQKLMLDSPLLSQPIEPTLPDRIETSGLEPSLLLPPLRGPGILPILIAPSAVKIGIPVPAVELLDLRHGWPQRH